MAAASQQQHDPCALRDRADKQRASHREPGGAWTGGTIDSVGDEFILTIFSNRAVLSRPGRRARGGGQ
eukprot:2009525-Prymnesium_polylepis.1